MRRLCFIALSLMLLSGCGQSDSNALFPDLKGRWASEKGARVSARNVVDQFKRADRAAEPQGALSKRIRHV